MAVETAADAAARELAERLTELATTGAAELTLTSGEYRLLENFMAKTQGYFDATILGVPVIRAE